MSQSPSPAPNSQGLIWIDLEMTGLNPDADRIIEMACIITDAALNIIAEGPVIAVNQPQALLDGMDEWNKRTHGGSGLIERVKTSTVSEAEAERSMLDFIGRHVPAKRSPMCGNSICQDRRFLARTMPALEAWFHYRNLDVSTLKELAVRWRPDMANGFTKKATHRALDDVRESIDELRYYREHFLKISS
ncbi:MAG: oligoribonuclease [Candidatus Muproteobacteria bacterium RBG_16_60_9]|uniref:Oligoribonuclease n=1 Tax=Candidatus Muproteobacteria bacterium RBG_16_60_9 TaxID=1817755 RepID=A0A1F6UXG4_9PROT|nr:MAG: oligoribonuclease [Candidatus Muproteobacteria bacterium RBG_16_60_9]